MLPILLYTSHHCPSEISAERDTEDYDLITSLLIIIWSLLKTQKLDTALFDTLDY